MMHNLQVKKGCRTLNVAFVTAFLLLTSVFVGRAQTTITTTGSFTNDTTLSTVTFNFQNTNSYAVVITGLDGIMADYGQNYVALWYKTSAINGSPGAIDVSNGWTMYTSSGNVSGIANISNNTTQPFLTGMNLVIPANTTYGLAVVATGSGAMLRCGLGSPAFSIGGGGCNVISGSNSGYASNNPPPAAPNFSPVAWLGKITFAQVVACTGTPAAATISGPLNVCSNALFTLTSTPYPAGTTISYQWQKYNSVTLVWEDIASETSNTYNCVSGITAATQFRLKTSCTPSGTPSYSNTLTVSIGGGLPGGVYTINNNAQSSATNFVSFSAAAAAMRCGITGAVTLNVDPNSGPYTEQVAFNNIPGTSNVNKIRINGRNRILQYANVDNTNPGILNILGTRYITVDSLTIRSLSTSIGIGAVISDTAKYDSLTHCFVDMRSLNVTSSAYTAGVSLSNYYYNSSFDYSSTENCYIGHNYILGGTGIGGPYYGIIDDYYYNNQQYQTDSGNVMDYNTIENFVYGGILTSGDNGTSICYNDIHRTNKASTSYFMGIRVYSGDYNNNSSALSLNKIKIVGNRIHDPSNQSSNTGFMGIYVLTDWYNGLNNNNEQSNILIANNAIYNVNSSSSSYVYGIYCIGGNNYNNNSTTDWDTTKIYHNTIDLSMVNSTTAGNTVGIYYINDYYNGNTNNDDEALFIRNNIVTVTGNNTSNAAFGFLYTDNYLNNSNYEIYPQRNNFYLNNPATTQYYGSYNGVNYNTMAAFQLANPTMEVGSLSVNPQYTSPATGDLTPLNYALYGNGLNVLADVSTDILGRQRSSAPTPGAFEITTDAGVSALASPLGIYCSSIKMVSVVLHNYGMLNVTNTQVQWTLNGVAQPTVAFTGNIAPNGNATVNLGNGLFLPNTPVTIKAWTYMPNGQTDGIPTNDTLTITTQSSTSVPVDIGPDDSICTGNTLTLNAGYPGSNYVWDNNSTAQTRTIQNAGTYYVMLTAYDGCIGVDTMKLYLRPLPVVDLGPDVEICEGTTYTFDAGHPGATYMWDNGVTTQTRTVDTAGDYEAQVTDGFGCTGVDNVSVGMKDIPLIDGINATHADSGLYTFYPLNPRYIINYVWNFGDGTPEVSGYMVQHQYAHNGIYTVTLKMEGECTGLIVAKSRTVDVFNASGEGTGISNTKFNGDISLYPNPAKNTLQIDNKSDAKMKRVAVYNTLGQLIIDQAADNAQHHQLNTSILSSGLYSIRIETDKGIAVQKFEVMK
ncbi:T9SS type A sorting domain-containing protein [Taibaiella lutea]|uniref:T9SS type A sorting domain-containing protein n=1 Tax=Taibaiella lutea TaxID=2608001 RepID=A0A5M6CDD3_9BACT|nr:T9SS type A sorting domain-containing protein [Taibaiella lutea]KAA5533188.1 T9SS type A sorting domain-containing protein [Taibaiella lutea]